MNCPFCHSPLPLFIIIFVFSSPRPLPCVNMHAYKQIHKEGGGAMEHENDDKTVASDCACCSCYYVIIKQNLSDSVINCRISDRCTELPFIKIITVFTKVFFFQIIRHGWWFWANHQIFWKNYKKFQFIFFQMIRQHVWWFSFLNKSSDVRHFAKSSAMSDARLIAFLDWREHCTYQCEFSGTLINVNRAL